MRNHIKAYLLLFLLTGVWATSVAQESSIEIGKKTIALDEPFSITLIIRSNLDKNTYSPFPDLPGMRRRDVSVSNSKEESNGKTILVQSITQNYIALSEGILTIPSFTITINGKSIASKGTQLTVGPPANPERAEELAASKLYEEILSMKNKFVDVQENAFLALTTDKDTVFVGEGFTVTLALYVAENNQAEMKSYQEGTQLVEILKSIKPSNCWEEDFGIREFQYNSVTIDKRKYAEYKMYQATFYPFNTDTIHFPEVHFKMIKYQVAQDPHATGPSKKEDFVTFHTFGKTVFVKELPPHPLRNGISVGVFRLQEEISNHKLQTGQSFSYQLRIVGEGNMSTVTLPPTKATTVFDFFSPSTKLITQLANNRVVGEKSFTFTCIAKEPGNYRWKNYFQWVYFNTHLKAYDTLASSIVLQVGGESLKNMAISANDLGPAYNNLFSENSQKQPLFTVEAVRKLANMAILVMLVVTLLLLFIKR
jgi:hypothetical protein